MHLRTLLLVAGGACALSGAAEATPSLEIKDAVARLTVVPEDRNDISVEVVRANPRLPLRVKITGERVVIDGDLDRRIQDCRGDGQSMRVVVRRLGEVGWRDIPQVVVRTPRAVQISAGGAVFGSIGRSDSVTLGNAGCGDWTLANVTGALRLQQAGSGDVRAGAAASASLRLAGSGDVTLAEIRGGLDVNIAGAGGVSARSIRGPFKASVAGPGDVRIDGGRATTMNVTVLGSGDVEFAGVADSLKANIAGAGDVRVKAVRGAVAKRIVGSGRVTIG